MYIKVNKLRWLENIMINSWKRDRVKPIGRSERKREKIGLLTFFWEAPKCIWWILHTFSSALNRRGSDEMGDRVSYLDSKGDVFIKTLVTAESRKDKNNSYHFFLNLDYQESIQAIFMFVIRNKKLNLKIIFVGFVLFCFFFMFF